MTRHPTRVRNLKEDPMKRIFAAIATSAMIVAGTGIAIAAASSVPEVDEANATIQLGSTKFVPTACTGVDGVPYVTLRGTWKGGETDLTPGSTPYNLTGPLTIKKVVWTINLNTDRGLLRGTAVLTGAEPSGAAETTYSGPVTLITQGLPGTAGETVPARGWVNAATYTNGVTDGGSLLANVELEVGSGYAANGELGNSTMGILDYSVTTNNQTC
jgi:hypothetical protein